MLVLSDAVLAAQAEAAWEGLENVEAVREQIRIACMVWQSGARDGKAGAASAVKSLGLRYNVSLEAHNLFIYDTYLALVKAAALPLIYDPDNPLDRETMAMEAGDLLRDVPGEFTEAQWLDTVFSLVQSGDMSKTAFRTLMKEWHSM